MSNKKILVLPGDGIGNEVMSEVLHIMDWMAKNKTLSFDVSERLVGGTAYDKEGDSISDSTMQEALDCDAILFGGRLNFPCKYLADLLKKPLVLPLYNRSGLNCSIIKGGIIRKGDNIIQIED